MSEEKVEEKKNVQHVPLINLMSKAEKRLFSKYGNGQMQALLNAHALQTKSDKTKFDKKLFDELARAAFSAAFSMVIARRQVLHSTIELPTNESD